MSFKAIVYRVLIASPGDLQEERDVIDEVVNHWNTSHATDEGMVLLPLRWEYSVPEYGDRPQAILNRRLVADCDMVIGAFWTRVGTPTGVSESGTVEEIEQFANAGKPVLLYFSSREIGPDRLDPDQLKRVRELRSRLEQVALIGQFSSPAQLDSKLTRDLIQQMRRLRSPSRGLPTPSAPPEEAAQSLPQSPRQVGKRPLDEAALGTLYTSYWERFSEVLRQSDVRLRPPTPSSRNYARVSLRSSDMRLRAYPESARSRRSFR